MMNNFINNIKILFALYIITMNEYKNEIIFFKNQSIGAIKDVIDSL